jgi:hypothetical protein
MARTNLPAADCGVVCARGCRSRQHRSSHRRIAQQQLRRTVLIALASLWAEYEGHQPHAPWSLYLAVMVLVPATAVGYLLPLPGTRKVQA